MTDDTTPASAGTRALVLAIALALPVGLAVLAERAGPAPGLAEEGAEETGARPGMSGDDGEGHEEAHDDD